MSPPPGGPWQPAVAGGMRSAGPTMSVGIAGASGRSTTDPRAGGGSDGVNAPAARPARSPRIGRYCGSRCGRCGPWSGWQPEPGRSRLRRVSRPVGSRPPGSGSMVAAAATSRRSKSLPHQAHSDQSSPTRPTAVGADALQPRPARRADDPFVVDPTLARRAVMDRLDLGEQRLLRQVALPGLADLLVRPDELVDPVGEDEEDRGRTG